MDEAEVRKIIRDEIQLSAESTLLHHTLIRIEEAETAPSDSRKGQVFYYNNSGTGLQQICISTGGAWKCATVDSTYS